MDVMEDVVTLFGTNFDVTLENVFATVEHTLRMLRTTGAERAYRKQDLETMRDRLLAAIAIALEASLAERAEDGHARQSFRECQYHDKLVKDLLRNEDAIISFNYDCVIDDSLRRLGDNKWNARYGYGFNLGPRGVNLRGEVFWQPEFPAKQDLTIHLHKLHGSLHFQFGSQGKKVNLKKRPYTKQLGTPRYTIIPPESNKAYDKGIFATLWKNAAQALGRAKHLIFIGYSLPATDLHSTALFRTSIKSGQLKSLVIANPDQFARARTRSVLQSALGEKTRILSCDSFEEFLQIDRSVWR